MLPQVSEAGSSSILIAAPSVNGSMQGGSCLGPELLSQLAGLSLDAAELERNHPPSAPLPLSAQASRYLYRFEACVMTWASLVCMSQGIYFLAQSLCVHSWVHSANLEALQLHAACMGTCKLLCAELSINVQCMCKTEHKSDWPQEECMHHDSLCDLMTTLLLNTISPSAFIALISLSWVHLISL